MERNTKINFVKSEKSQTSQVSCRNFSCLKVQEHVLPHVGKRIRHNTPSKFF